MHIHTTHGDEIMATNTTWNRFPQLLNGLTLSPAQSHTRANAFMMGSDLSRTVGRDPSKALAQLDADIERFTHLGNTHMTKTLTARREALLDAQRR